MANVRAVLLMNTVRFIKEVYGPEAHEQVLKALPVQHAGSFVGSLRESAFKPFSDLVAYMECAKGLLAPDDADFYRKVGEFSGRLDRERAGFSPMVADPSTAIRLARVIWRSFYDVGWLEVVTKGPKEALVRIHDFPASRSHCERMRAAWAAMVSTPESRARVEETACTADGSPYCEMRVVWD